MLVEIAFMGSFSNKPAQGVCSTQINDLYCCNLVQQMLVEFIRVDLFLIIQPSVFGQTVFLSTERLFSIYDYNIIKHGKRINSTISFVICQKIAAK